MAPRHVRPERAPLSFGQRLIGGLGEILITAGVLVGLFVVWQVFWTDVQGQQLASEYNMEFEQAAGAAPDELALQLVDPPPSEDEGIIDGTFARIYVPRWGSDYVYPIAQGVDKAAVLDKSWVGHYPDTAMPGEVGNFALAGHRQSYGKPFYGVHDLQMGDLIIVETADRYYTYEVNASKIVKPTDTYVISDNPLDPGAEVTDRMITLTTCHPLWSIAERWIIHGELVSWNDRADGKPAALLGGA